MFTPSLVADFLSPVGSSGALCVRNGQQLLECATCQHLARCTTATGSMVHNSHTAQHTEAGTQEQIESFYLQIDDLKTCEHMQAKALEVHPVPLIHFLHVFNG